MVLTTDMLNEIAQDFGADTFYLGFSSDTALTADISATSLDGEIGSRVPCSVTILDNQVSVTGVRAASYVIDTASGDVLTGVALFNLSSGGDMWSVTTLPSIRHTINFDFDFDIPITFIRG
jgi:hypothetical protein